MILIALFEPEKGTREQYSAAEEAGAQWMLHEEPLNPQWITAKNLVNGRQIIDTHENIIQLITSGRDLHY